MNTDNTTFNADRVVVLTQAQRKQHQLDKLRWHLERKPDLSLTEMAQLLSVSIDTAKRLRRSLKGVQS